MLASLYPPTSPLSLLVLSCLHAIAEITETVLYNPLPQLACILHPDGECLNVDAAVGTVRCWAQHWQPTNQPTKQLMFLGANQCSAGSMALLLLEFFYSF